MKSVKKGRNAAEQRLVELYEAYPRHVGRIAALREIERAVKRIAQRDGLREDAVISRLLYRVQKFAASPVGQNGEFTPHPATWFRAGRYDDDPKEWLDGETRRRIDQERAENQVARQRRARNVADYWRDYQEHRSEIAKLLAPLTAEQFQVLASSINQTGSKRWYVELLLWRHQRPRVEALIRQSASRRSQT